MNISGASCAGFWDSGWLRGEILEDYDGCHKIVEAVCEKNAEEMFKL